MNRNSAHRASAYLLLSVLGLAMVFPLLWLVASSLKTNQEIFGSLALLPRRLHFEAYALGWRGTGQFGFHVFFLNTFRLVGPTVLLTVVSSAVVAYGFARFDFPLKRALFVLMLATMMLPGAVLIVPRFVLFRRMGWIDTYLPFIVPAALACGSFFTFMLVQFYRGVPRELDESAIIDGCGSLRVLLHILLPLSKAALFSAGIFQFIWTWNDFFNALIYITSVRKYTVSLGLRMSLDLSAVVQWNQVMAMAVLVMVPSVLLFFLAQRYFIEGIATTGLKG